MRRSARRWRLLRKLIAGIENEQTRGEDENGGLRGDRSPHRRSGNNTLLLQLIYIVSVFGYDISLIPLAEPAIHTSC